MPPSTPFVDPDTGSIDSDQLLAETIPLAKLVGFVVAIALVPFAIAFLLSPHSGLTVIFAVAAQFILAVGSGIVLMYVIARGIHLSGHTVE